MSNYNHEILLKNGEKVLIRQLSADDAPAMHDFAGALFSSSDAVITTPEEFQKRTVEDSKKRMATNGDAFWFGLGAFASSDPSKIIGNIDMTTSARKKLKHVGQIGMGLLSPYRGIGLGTALFQYLLKNVDRFPQIERIELEVLASNHAGLALYKKMGFVIEGTRRKAFKQLDGRMEDSIVMSLLREDLWQIKK